VDRDDAADALVFLEEPDEIAPQEGIGSGQRDDAPGACGASERRVPRAALMAIAGRVSHHAGKATDLASRWPADDGVGVRCGPRDSDRSRLVERIAKPRPSPCGNRGPDSEGGYVPSPKSVMR